MSDDKKRPTEAAKLLDELGLVELLPGGGWKIREKVNPLLQYLKFQGKDYKQIQDSLLAEEKETGRPVSQVAFERAFSNLSKVLGPNTMGSEDFLRRLDTGAFPPGALDDPTDAGTESGDGSAGGLVQTGEDVVQAPILELLAEMRSRRDTNATRAREGLTATRELAGSLAPSKYMPGYERGGLADIMMGFLSGKGKNHGGLPEEMRAPQQLPVNLSLLDMISQPEPGIESDMPMASDLAQKILAAAMRIPRYSQVSSSGGGGSGADTSVEDYLAAALGGQ